LDAHIDKESQHLKPFAWDSYKLLILLANALVNGKIMAIEDYLLVTLVELNEVQFGA